MKEKKIIFFDIDGTIDFIFQPSEENCMGA